MEASASASAIERERERPSSNIQRGLRRFHASAFHLFLALILDAFSVVGVGGGENERKICRRYHNLPIVMNFVANIEEGLSSFYGWPRVRFKSKNRGLASLYFGTGYRFDFFPGGGSGWLDASTTALSMMTDLSVAARASLCSPLFLFTTSTSTSPDADFVCPIFGRRVRR